MAALTIRQIDETTKAALRIRAAQHGVSMEEEVRQILREAVFPTGLQSKLGQRLLNRFAQAAGGDFAVPTRQMPRTPPNWDA